MEWLDESEKGVSLGEMHRAHGVVSSKVASFSVPLSKPLGQIQTAQPQDPWALENAEPLCLLPAVHSEGRGGGGVGHALSLFGDCGVLFSSYFFQKTISPELKCKLIIDP